MFLKALYHSSVDLIPSASEKTLTVRFHSLTQPRFNRMLHTLCEFATEVNYIYLGSELRMVYEAPECNF